MPKKSIALLLTLPFALASCSLPSSGGSSKGSSSVSSSQASRPSGSGGSSSSAENPVLDGVFVTRNGILYQYMPLRKAYKVIGKASRANIRRLGEGEESSLQEDAVDIPNEIDGEPVVSVDAGAFAEDDVTAVTLSDNTEDIGADFIAPSEDFHYNEYGNGGYIGSHDNPYFALATILDTTVSAFHVHPDCEFLLKGCFGDYEGLKDLYLNEGIKQIANIFDATIYSPWKSETVSYHLPSLEAYLAIDFSGYYLHRPIAYYLGEEPIDDLVLPAGIADIKPSSFQCGTFSSLTLPEGVKTVGANAFTRCANLKTVHLPSTLETVGLLAFSYGAIEELDLKAVVTIEEAGFAGNSLKELTLPEGLKTIGITGFAMNDITQVSFPDSLEYIGRNAFDFNEMEEVTLPPNLIRFESDTFFQCPVRYNEYGGCYYLGTKDNPYEVFVKRDFWNWDTSLDRQDELREITLHPNTKHLSSMAFEGNNVTKVALNDGLKTIGDNVFLRCDQLQTVNIPDSVDSFGRNIFAECPSLIANQQAVKDGEDFLAYYLGSQTNPYAYLLRVERTGYEEQNYTTREQTRAIGNSAFHFGGVDKLTITGNVQVIDEEGLNGVTANDIEIQEGVVSVGHFSFATVSTFFLPSSVTEFGGASECENLTTVNLSPNLKSLGQFNTCRNLREILVPASVTKLGSLAYNCPSVERIYVPKDVAVNGCLYFLEIGKDESMAEVVKPCALCFEATATPDDFTSYFYSDLDNVTAYWGYALEA